MKKIMLAGAVLCLPVTAFCEEENECDFTPGLIATVSLGIGLGGNPCDVETNYGKTKFLHQIFSAPDRENYSSDWNGTATLEGVIGSAQNKETGLEAGLKNIKACKSVDELKPDEHYTGAEHNAPARTRDLKIDRNKPMNAQLGLGLNYVTDDGWNIGLSAAGTVDEDNKNESYNPGIESETGTRTMLKSQRFSASADIVLGRTKNGWTGFIGGGVTLKKTEIDQALQYQGETVKDLVSIHTKQNKVRPNIIVGIKRKVGNNVNLVTSVQYIFSKNKTCNYGYVAVGMPFTGMFRTTNDDNTLVSDASHAGDDGNKIAKHTFENEYVFATDPGSVKLKQKGAFSVSVAAEYSFPFSGL